MTDSKSLFLLSLISTFLLLHSQCFSESPESEWVGNPSSIMAFADHLYENGDYHRAISEYKRFVFLFPQEPRVLQARFKTGVSYEKSGHLENAIEVFEGILADDPSPQVSQSVQYEIGKCFFLGRDYQASARALKILNTDRSLALSGWALLRAKDYRHASEAFDDACQVRPDGYLRDLCTELSEESLEGERIPRRSAGLAALLSVPVPGAGRAYCGRLGDGIFSFLLVSASYAGAYHYYDDDEVGFSLGLLTLGLLFHAGDVYGAANSARRFNAFGEEDFIKGIEERHDLAGILLD